MALAVLAASVADADDDAAKAEKRPSAYRTISEVAEDLALPQHVLRFWESRFAQVRPLKRAGGRRYYRPDDVDLLKGIHRLLHGQGYTIRGAQRVLKQNGIRFVQAIGRGEAEAGAPPLAEREPDTEASPADPAQAAAAPEDDAILHEVVRELRACRKALAGLRPGAAEEV